MLLKTKNQGKVSGFSLPPLEKIQGQWADFSFKMPWPYPSQRLLQLYFYYAHRLHICFIYKDQLRRSCVHPLKLKLRGAMIYFMRRWFGDDSMLKQDRGHLPSLPRRPKNLNVSDEHWQGGGTSASVAGLRTSSWNSKADLHVGICKVRREMAHSDRLRLGPVILFCRLSRITALLWSSLCHETVCLKTAYFLSRWYCSTVKLDSR